MPNAGSWLRQARQEKGWTQAEAAARLNVSQGYVSLVERGMRVASAGFMKALEEVYTLPALEADREPPTDQNSLARDLSTLGYEPLAYLKARARRSPESVLLSALASRDLESRLAEALPWVVVTYSDLNWDWLVDRAKRRDLQNRLGYVVTLAREVAQQRGDFRTATRLLSRERKLEGSLLAREDTLCHESMTQVEREWLRDKRPDQAKRWHLLTDLTSDRLPYAA